MVAVYTDITVICGYVTFIQMEILNIEKMILFFYKLKLNIPNNFIDWK